MAADISLREGAKLDINYTLQQQNGAAYPRSSISRLWFYIRKRKGSSAIVKLSDRTNLLADNTSEIQWTNETGGLCTVKIRQAHTTGQVSMAAYFELRGLLTSGGYVTFDFGTMDITESIVDIASDY